MLTVIFSDVQVADYKQFNKGKRRLKNCITAINKAFEFAAKNGITTILFSGDLYDTQQVLGTEVVNEVVSVFDKWANSGITVYAISGNHDHASKNLIDKPAVTALRHLELAVDNFYLLDNSADIIEGEEKRVNVIGIPYYEYSTHFRQALINCREMLVEGCINILLMHQTPNEMGNDMIPADTDINDPLYEGFDFIFNGHIHKHAMLSNKFMNVGSPLHRTLEDEGQKKGFIVMDLEYPQEGYKFIDTKLPMFKKMYEEDITEADSNDYIITVPKPLKSKNTVENEAKTENFKADLSPAELIKNYWAEVDGKNTELLNIGLTLL